MRIRITDTGATADWLALHNGDDHHWAIRFDAIDSWHHAVGDGYVRIQLRGGQWFEAWDHHSVEKFAATNELSDRLSRATLERPSPVMRAFGGGHA